MKIVISIFALPYEIDDLENVLLQLRKCSYHIDKKIEYVLNVTMCTSNELINWNKSSLPKSYFTDRLLKLSAHTDWCLKTFQTSDDIKGVVSQRRHTLEKHPDASYFIWLDTDIIFDEMTLFHFERAINGTKRKFKYSIIVPETVRLWDEGWDCLVNENYIDKPIGYQEKNDPYKDSGIKGDVIINGVKNTVPNQPKYKFGGGWFTCLSSDLLTRIGIPESFGHYGYDNIFIMFASEKLNNIGEIQIQQFKIKNLVVCENYKYRNNAHYLNNLSVYDKRIEFKKIAESNFNLELEKII